jgi:D-hydroxyproline dehydrogenase
MPHPTTALVIGGGIVGLNVALALQERGLAVTIIDQQTEIPPASWGNAGHIGVEQVEPLASWATLRSVPRQLFMRGGAVAFPPGQIGAWLPFGLRLVRAAAPARFARGKAALKALAAEALPAWRRRVEAAGAESLLIEEGHILLWESEATAKAGRKALAETDTGTTRFRDLSAEEAAGLSSLLPRPPADGVRFEGTARVADPGDMLTALGAAFEARGGLRETGSALLDPATLARAQVVIVTAGVRSGALLRPLGHRVPIIAERGYHIQTAETDWPNDLTPVVFEDRTVVFARFRSGLRATSFTEFAAPGASPDPRKWRRLREHATALGVPFPASASEWMGERPTLPDYLPAIGRSRHARNLFYAFGHQHLGLTLSAITGELVSALVTGERPAIDCAPFDLARFGE